MRLLPGLGRDERDAVSSRLFAVAAFGALVACAPLRGTFAPSRDYADYREYRLAQAHGERLGAAWRYLRDHPRGEFNDEVARWFYPEEARFWNEAGRTPGGAAAYLELMPDGPHAEAERTFLRAFEIEKREGPLRTQRALEAARKKAEAARRALGDAVELWTKRATHVDEAFRQPLSVLHKTELGKFYDADPYPVCDAEGCSKFLSFTYAVPDVQTPLDRTVVLDVRVELTAGLVTGIALVLPKRGFTWWLEGAEGRNVDPADETTRTEAIALAKNRVEKVVRAARGGDCTTTEADAVRTILCGDLRVTVGTTPTGDDVVHIVSLGQPKGG